jgi:hypothetical protein
VKERGASSSAVTALCDRPHNKLLYQLKRYDLERLATALIFHVISCDVVACAARAEHYAIRGRASAFENSKDSRVEVHPTVRNHPVSQPAAPLNLPPFFRPTSNMRRLIREIPREQ